ncbi:hypothetical protein KWH75_07355 [Morganella morganii]|uniref:hypothetical protein n=1 Tax=Morganella morganii TaxID=582 RepID=UPI0021D326D7|nr:hypothetical protein [Morganella morganii]MCU6236885.1 hypothetical protein [Morganella morganii]
MSSNRALLLCLAEHFPALPAGGWTIRPLNGLTRESVSIEQKGVSLIGRAQTVHSADIGVSRQKEARILYRLRDSGLAPRVAGFSHGWLLLYRVAGETLPPERMQQPRFIPQLAALVSNLHNQPLTGYRLPLKAQADRHFHLTDKRRRTPQLLRIHRHFMREAEPQPLKLAPAHMDIHPGNIVTAAGELDLIDWEYAADTDIGLSLATLFRANHWSLTLIHTFLRYYSAYHCPQRVLAQTCRWQARADYMMVMWFESRWGQTGDPQFLQYPAALKAAAGLR